MKKTLKITLTIAVLIIFSCSEDQNFESKSAIISKQETSRPTPLVMVSQVAIGTQVWMSQNLNTSRYQNGDVIPQVQDHNQWKNLSTGAWCYYNNDISQGQIYGKLYNWYAVNDPRGLAPLGWHVPSDSEWTTLTTHLGGQGVAGGKMKATGTSLWLSPNLGATNNSGFTGLPGGGRDSNSGLFTPVGGRNGFWWSRTESGAGIIVWTRYLDYATSNAANYTNSKKAGFSVRCLRD